MGKDQRGKKHEFRRKDHQKMVAKAKKMLAPKPKSRRRPNGGGG